MWLRRAASDLFYAENPMAHGGGERKRERMMLGGLCSWPNAYSMPFTTACWLRGIRLK